LVEENEQLSAQNQVLATENSDIRDRLAWLEQNQADLQAVMARMLENQQARMVLTSTVMN